MTEGDDDEALADAFEIVEDDPAMERLIELIDMLEPMDRQRLLAVYDPTTGLRRR